jgi:hypothetical protein
MEAEAAAAAVNGKDFIAGAAGGSCHSSRTRGQTGYFDAPVLSQTVHLLFMQLLPFPFQSLPHRASYS